MTTTKKAASPPLSSPNGVVKPPAQYRCGTVHLSGTDDGLFERHLVFDNIIKPKEAGAREQFEAFARSVRDILSQRWVLTETTYERENPKRVYYLSMEFLRSEEHTSELQSLRHLVCRL